MKKRYPSALAAALLTGALALSAAPSTFAQPARGHEPTAAQLQSLAAGIQVAPKAGLKASSAAGNQPNPYLANVPDATRVDYSTWQRRLVEKSAVRARSDAFRAAQLKAVGKALPPVLVHDEDEPTGSRGSNDTRATAERVRAVGTGKGDNPRVRILGNLPDLAPAAAARPAAREDNGQLNRAGATTINGVARITTTGVLGDGPHGTKGDKKNDFDFYRLTSTAGLTITVDTSATPINNEGVATDTVVALYSASGKLLAADDDSGTAPFSSKLSFLVHTSGTYYALVAGFSDSGSLPKSPTNSGSGAGGAEVGPYKLTLTSGPVDTDLYAFRLAKGDVVGASGAGAANTVTMYRSDGTRMVTSGQDASAIYPASSPLPGGGKAVLAYVAEKSGWYAVKVDGEPGQYDLTVETYRPGSELEKSGTVQTVFLDFDGQRVNTAIWGGAGVRTLSPFSAFIPKWGLDSSQEATLIDRITAGVQENIQRDLVRKGLNKSLKVRVLSSRTHADVFGQPNVSRVIVGGTIEQSGVPTIGIAEDIDPGNYRHDDSALMMLDVLSGPASEETSLNHYLKPSSDRVAFVSQAVSNTVSHEIGHLIGNFHTDNMDKTLSLMDAGGANFGNLYGVGKDKIGGTRDDSDVDFATDTYIPAEGFTGKENTLNVSSWAYGEGRQK